MEPTQTLDETYHEDEAYQDAATSNDRRVLPGSTRTGSHQTHGHHYEAFTIQDNARVHTGDVHSSQHTHYHEAPLSHPHARKTSLLDALAFEQMDFRSATIAPAHAKTCEWLFSSSSYKRWRNQGLASKHTGFLWIKGKPGAGKSTLMKHALEHARVEYAHEKTVSFFFNARGAALGKSVEGMYRCLLHQMVGQVPHLSGEVAVADRSVYRSEGWPVAVLQDLFRKAVLHLCRQTRMSCYIDALDEGDDEDQVRDMVDFFSELAEQSASETLSFCVCLASRYYPKISMSSFEELRLEDHSGHYNDISEFVHNKLRLADRQLKEQLSSEIMRRSSGVFLWVVLVVAILNKEGDHGNRHLLVTRLQEIPDGLLQLVEDLRNRDASDNRFAPAIQWVLYALRPLEPRELYIAILASIGGLADDTVHWAQHITNDTDMDVIIDFIVSSSRGLLEIGVSSSSPLDYVIGRPSASGTVYYDMTASRPEITLTVQFIHEVVREYFLSAAGFIIPYVQEKSDMALGNIPGVVQGPSASYAKADIRTTLGKREFTPSCHSPDDSFSLDGTKIDLASPERYPRLRRVRDIDKRPRAPKSKKPVITQGHHDNLVEPESVLANDAGTITHSRFSLICQSYIRTSHVREHAPKSRRPTTTPSTRRISPHAPFLTYCLDMALRHAEIASKNGCCVRDLSQNFPWDEWAFYKSAEHARSAASGGELRTDLSQSDIHSKPAYEYRRLDTWLQKMAYENHPHLVKDELSSIASNEKKEVFHSLLNACARGMGSALHISASRTDSIQCCRLLLDGGANINQICPNVGSPLHVMVRTGSAKGVRFFLQYGADATILDNGGNSALHYAILSKDVRIIGPLLSRSVNEGMIIGVYGDIVQTAGELNDWKFMRKLPGIGVSVDALNFSDSGPYENPDKVLMDYSKTRSGTSRKAWLTCGFLVE